jgi:hypothetical protein
MAPHDALLVSEYALMLIVLEGVVYLCGVLVILIYSRFGLSPNWRDYVLGIWTIAQAFGFAALTIGWLAGNSRTPVLGTLLPAVLTFLGGFLIYAFGQDSTSKPFVLVTVPLISLMLYVGTGMGSFERAHYNDQQDIANVSRIKSQLRNSAELESAFNLNRDNLQLGPAGATTIEIIRHLLKSQDDEVKSSP